MRKNVRPKPTVVESVIEDGLKHISSIMLLLFVIISIIIYSDIFVSKVLRRFDGATIGDTPTTWGTCVQIALQTLAVAGMQIGMGLGVIE